MVHDRDDAAHGDSVESGSWSSLTRRARMTVATVAVVSSTLTAAVAGHHIASGADDGEPTVYVPTMPCRLVDTRATGDTVGPQDEPIGHGETVEFGAHDGTDADSVCTVPTDATALAANVAAIEPTADGFLTLFPGDVPHPGTSTLDVVAGQAPTLEAATVPLGDDGSFNVFNAFGSTEVVVEVTGYFVPPPTASVGCVQSELPNARNGRRATRLPSLPQW